MARNISSLVIDSLCDRAQEDNIAVAGLYLPIPKVSGNVEIGLGGLGTQLGTQLGMKGNRRTK